MNQGFASIYIGGAPQVSSLLSTVDQHYPLKNPATGEMYHLDWCGDRHVSSEVEIENLFNASGDVTFLAWEGPSEQIYVSFRAVQPNLTTVEVGVGSYSQTEYLREIAMSFFRSFAKSMEIRLVIADPEGKTLDEDWDAFVLSDFQPVGKYLPRLLAAPSSRIASLSRPGYAVEKLNDLWAIVEEGCQT
jgi:hypothetical protein